MTLREISLSSTRHYVAAPLPRSPSTIINLSKIIRRTNRVQHGLKLTFLCNSVCMWPERIKTGFWLKKLASNQIFPTSCSTMLMLTKFQTIRCSVNRLTIQKKKNCHVAPIPGSGISGCVDETLPSIHPSCMAGWCMHKRKIETWRCYLMCMNGRRVG